MRLFVGLPSLLNFFKKFFPRNAAFVLYYPNRFAWIFPNIVNYPSDFTWRDKKMALFYENLKLILDELGLSNYEAGNKCGIPSQTIDYQIKHKVDNPKTDTLEKLSKGLGVSINRLLFGSDNFNLSFFISMLDKKNIEFEQLVLETGANPTDLLKCILPSADMQQKIADYVGIPKEKLFILPCTGMEYLTSQNVKSYLRPDINSDPKTNEDMSILYRNLSPISKRLVYNLAYDLSIIELENSISIKKLSYWEKEKKQ